MTDRMFLLDAAAWGDATPGGTVTVTGAEARHAVQVVRLRVGERVLLSDGAGRRARAQVRSVGRDDLVVELLEVELVVEPNPRFVLVQALARGDRDEQAIEAATELGVDEVVPWQAERSIVQWRGPKLDKGRARWQAVVAAATKQSRRGRLPRVAPLADLTSIAALVATADRALVLHELAEIPLAGLTLPTSGTVVLVVGPEGGITERELGALRGAGATMVRLGPEVLRSSSAGPAALAVLNAATRWR